MQFFQKTSQNLCSRLKLLQDKKKKINQFNLYNKKESAARFLFFLLKQKLIRLSLNEQYLRNKKNRLFICLCYYEIEINPKRIS